MKINLGCGANKLADWENHDADVDITQRLPWSDGEATHVFAEHVVEHVPFDDAVQFFRECHRILCRNGVCRIAVPSVEQIRLNATPEYCLFTQRWAQPSGDDIDSQVRGAMTNILFRHGHRAPWTEGLLLATLYYAGFDHLVSCTPGQSSHRELQGVEGHGRVISDKFNRIETVVVEATK